MGASKGQVLAFAIVPQIMPAFIGNNLYALDRNIRMATMLGIVGAGGIVMNYNPRLECLNMIGCLPSLL